MLGTQQGPAPPNWWAWLTPRNAPHPQLCHLAIGQTYEQDYGDPPEKFDRSCPTFHGHLRSLELTRVDRPPVTSS